ncbi:MAG TPA: iron-sulfur cluster assembly scaffold protein [Woeseiaceae bacterium]|nr:iron-sulfur cluster assembly scaffold protein [Woeseiaceae bacterium]
MSGDPYSAEVRRRFAHPVHAGDLPVGHARAASAAAADSAAGCRLLVAAAVEGRVLRTMRFRAFGCPHLIAAAELACEECEGRAISALEQVSAPVIMERLAVPVEKTGRILLLEDALGALAAKLAEGTNGTEN